MALGGAKTALIQDSSAVAHNPAALTDLQTSEVSVSINMIQGETEFTGPDGRVGETESSLITLGNLFAAGPMQAEGWSWGFGITTPYGQSVEWPQYGAFWYNAPDFAELLVVDFSPTIAYALNDRVSLGAGLDFNYSRLDFQQAYPWARVTGVPGLPDGCARIQGEGWGLGANAGILIKPVDGQRLSLTYTSPFDVEYEGDFTIGEIPPPLQGGVLSRSDFKGEIQYPSIVALGYGVQVTDQLSLGAGVEWLEHSRYRQQNYDIGANNAAGLLPPSIPQNWKDTWTLGFGGQYRVTTNWLWRAGYMWVESPIPESTMTPSLPAADTQYFSLGCGYTRGTRRLDLTYVIALMEDAEVRANLNPAFSGVYVYDSQIFSISFTQSL